MYEILIAFRFIRSGRVPGFVNFISIMATIGISLGVAALIIVLSVMNGFQTEVRDKMLSVLSHVEVFSRTNADVNLKKLKHSLPADDEILGFAPFTYSQGMVAGSGQILGVIVRGIDPKEEISVSDTITNILSGNSNNLKKNSFGVIIGSELAKILNLKVSDSLMLMTVENASSPVGVIPRMKKFVVKAVFSSGHYEYDKGLILIHQSDARKFFKFSGVEGLRIKLKDMHQAPIYSDKLQKKIGEEFLVRDWTHENKNWFAAVQIEKRMMFIILTLIIAVAAFNLVSMLVMTVNAKKADIAILRTVGSSKFSILSIFMIQGTFLGFIGVMIGVSIGVISSINLGKIIAVVESLFNFELLPKGIYLINTFPSDLRASDVGLISFVSLALSFLATIYPSLKASKIEPAQALKNE